MVLNGDSTHPNPWRPQSQIEGLWQVYFPYRIYKHPRVVGPIPEGYNFVRDKDFSTQFIYGLRKGTVVGVCLALYDHWYVTNNALKTQNEKIARGLYIAAPFALMGMTYFSSREALGRIAVNMGKEKDTGLSYWLAGPPTAAIYYAFTKDARRAFGGAIFIGMIGRGTKFMADIGWKTAPDENMDAPIKQFGFMNSYFNFGSIYDKGDSGAAWKKWVDQEKEK